MGAFDTPYVNGPTEVSRSYLREYGTRLKRKVDGGRPLSHSLDAASSIESKSVAILLCTCNGARFLPRQMESFFAQKHQNFKIWASDDGSIDQSRRLLKHYKSRFGKDRISIRQGPQQGPTTNFLSLLCCPEIQGDYFAYADQDDVWRSDKISRAIAELERFPQNVAALYCSRTCLIDENQVEIGYSPLFEKAPSFANSLVQNIGGGNTMVMNEAARDLLCAVGEKDVVSHDWWVYMIVSGAGGIVIYDPDPTVLYRQHGDNQVGSNIGWSNRLKRIRELLKGRFRRWNDKNTRALREVRFLLTPENQRILDEFCEAREQGLFGRFAGMFRSGIYRQTLLGNLGLIAATVLKKI